MRENIRLGKFLDLEKFCTCTMTYQAYQDHIDPYPKSEESILALQELCMQILDPIIEHFGEEQFELTYGFCSVDLKRYLERKNANGQRNGRVAPRVDQHMSCELKLDGELYCKHQGASCDFRIVGIDSKTITQWIVDQALPFDSLYYYGPERPIHISHGQRFRKALWGFSERGIPARLTLKN
jgi:hypothetical protein